MGSNRSCSLLLFFMILMVYSALSLLPGSLASPDEVYGVVVNVIDGDTFDLRVEKSDPRIENSIERIALADVCSPDIKTVQGPGARDFTYAVLMNKRVYLDIDDLNRGRDSEGSLVAVAYLAGTYGQPIPYPNFNLLLVDAGHAMLANQTDNEFDPKYWRDGIDSESTRQNDSQNDLLTRISDEVGEQLSRAGQAAWDWLRAEITNSSLELVNSSLDRAFNRS